LRKSEVEKRILESEVSMMGISYVDLGGITRDKPVTITEIDRVFREGNKTARANLALTSLDTMTPDSSVNLAQGDVSVVPDLSTFVIPSYSPRTARFIGDLYESSGKPSSLCSRSVYRRVLEQTKKHGYAFGVGFESEFHLVTKSGDRILPADLSSIQSQAGFDIHQELIQELLAGLRSVGIAPIKAHAEGGRGQLEIDAAPGRGMKVADNYVYFKDVVKAIARKYGWTASFMPKIGHDWWGSGLHLHVSLFGRGSRNLFYDGMDHRKLRLSSTCYYFLGGLLEHLKALCAIVAPTVNSYRRLLPGRWNADAATYAPGHRGAALRVPDERLQSTRVELRMPDNTCNIYLALACVLAAGMDGIRKKTDPGGPVKFDTSSLTDRRLKAKGLQLLPRSLDESIQELEKDDLFQKVLGNDMFEEYLKNKSSEASAFADKVTKWEQDHFLEVF
jgi:glutamine synthetase